MRPLTDEETKALLTKLSDYMGENVKYLIERDDEPYVFRLIQERIYYMSESLMKLAANISRENLFHVGTCFGKFSKSGKCKLHITALDYVAKYAKNKVWLKSQGEQAYVYGNHIIKAHIGRMTENMLQYQGVVVFSMNDTALGFGVASRSTLQAKDVDPTTIIIFNQTDIGEYLRVENE